MTTGLLTARKLSLSVESIAQMMNLEKEEVLFFPALSELRAIISDNNFGKLSEEQLTARLLAVSKENSFYETAIQRLEAHLKGRY